MARVAFRAHGQGLIDADRTQHVAHLRADARHVAVTGEEQAVEGSQVRFPALGEGRFIWLGFGLGFGADHAPQLLHPQDRRGAPVHSELLIGEMELGPDGRSRRPHALGYALVSEALAEEGHGLILARR